VHEGGAITLVPISPTRSAEEVSSVIQQTVKDYRKTLRKLA